VGAVRPDRWADRAISAGRMAHRLRSRQGDRPRRVRSHDLRRTSPPGSSKTATTCGTSRCSSGTPAPAPPHATRASTPTASRTPALPSTACRSCTTTADPRRGRAHSGRC
jgi:hypothetical protein